MFTFKDCITTLPILRFVYDNLHLCSPLGRKEVLQIHFIKDAAALETCFNEIDNVLQWQETNEAHLYKVKQLLSAVQDIFATISRLQNNDALDDIELFEIKKSTLIMHDLSKILAATSFTLFTLHDVSEVITILDPEKTSLPHFYIYSSYSKELTTLRNKSKTTRLPEEKEDLLWQIAQLENRIREHLVKKMASFASVLAQNLKYIAKLDMLLAKAALALEWNCCKPEISDNDISYVALFHPVVVQRLKKENAEFQPVHINLKQEPCLITGANMTGKSIFLRAIAFSQWMFQFGFYVPAQKASIVPVEKIHFVAGDSDTEHTGLSSFVNEIFHIHHILQEVKEDKKMLILVDEFARTTNPKEGSALVTAFLEMMNHKKSICLVTTHYSNVEGDFRRLRVKGIQWDKMEHIKTHPQKLNKFIDYQLEDCNEKTAPEEAVKIAEILAIDGAFISLVKNYLRSNKNGTGTST
ncbi:MAG: DNA mismatch repair protein MutS [Bacteroidetes bacterium]|nr:DNA mismatch repair protein MutS [Bacteroidota bacterium]MCL1969650.1 DNA mismatch repair protein MutS [Bacteroidota bacterium]